eukprot:jgi/Psemu1/31884/gm1.31884_g
MENGVNVEGHPLPSTPTTTGLAWNKANSLFVNTGDLSPVTVGMFLSLAAEGANHASSNEQMSPDCALLMECHCTINQLSIKSPRKQIFKNDVSFAYTKNKNKNSTLTLSFLSPPNSTATQDTKQSPPKAGPSVKTATAITFENREMAQGFITTHYPLIHKRSSKPNACYLPKGTTYEYQCFVAKSQRGSCRAHLEVTIGDCLEEGIGQCRALKVHIVGNCTCGGDGTSKQRGVSPQDVLVLNSVMKDRPKLKPKAMAGEVLKALVQEDSLSVPSPELRSQLGKKLKNKIKHQFVRERKLDTRSSNVTNLKDLVKIKGSLGFTLPQQANTSIQSEEDLKGWGSSLFDLECLRVAPCEGVTNCCSQAYNLITVLQSSNSEPSNNVSNSEKNLYAHLQKLQGQSKRSDTQVWDRIVPFSLLSLLYSVVCCRTLVGYKVTASADGFHGTCSKNCHVLTFGAFAIQEDGS